MAIGNICMKYFLYVFNIHIDEDVPLHMVIYFFFAVQRTHKQPSKYSFTIIVLDPSQETIGKKETELSKNPVSITRVRLILYFICSTAM